MRQRLITGVIGGLAVLLLLLSSLNVFSIAVGLISLYALHEMYTAIKINKNILLYITGLLFSAIFLVAEFLSKDIFMPLILLYVGVMLCIMLAYYKTVKLEEVAIAVFMTIYIVYAMSTLRLVRAMPNGHFNIFLVFVGAFGTDTFAYFVGITLGKRKLSPEISPKKTVEGAIGGVLGVILCYLVMGFIMKTAFSVNVNYVNFIILGLLCGFFSEIGDLVASLIKRQYGIKDYGNLLPGHGGIMDRLDSVIFVAPIVYYFIKNIPVLG